ncbi:hypothetical protein Ndes2526B_g08649 [Nannochloris sp. 'desiccata']|nr:hypothetical protein NADE_001373 [Chlorella desiccata (nom. nud.)]
MGRATGSDLCLLTLLSVVLALRLPSLVVAQANSLHPNTHRALLQSSNGSTCCSRLEAIGFSSPLPVVIFDSSGQLIPHKVDTEITLCTCSPQDSNIQDYSGPARAAGRGSSSAKFDKKSYKLKTLGPDGNGLDFPLLGMPEDDDWILYGPEPDKTIGMRNYLAYNLARASGRYATRTTYVEVFLLDDGEELSMEHYNGVYIAQEKMKRGQDRVDIKKLDPENLSGGYLFVYDNDNIESGDVTFGPLEGFSDPFVLQEPNEFPLEEDPTGTWLFNYLTEFQTALNNGDLNYTSYIDGPSFTDYFLLTELSKNPDGYRGSTYMHKDRDGPLSMGPAWDYDEAFGICCGYPITGWDDLGQSGPGLSGGSAISPEGWRFNICDEPERCLIDPTDGVSIWYRTMWNTDERFKAGAALRWNELRASAWSNDAVQKIIDDARTAIDPAVARNFDKYASALEVETGANYEEIWQEEVSVMENWVMERFEWMDSQFSSSEGNEVETVTLSQSGR